MTAKLFSLRRSDGPPSTQFASTIVAMPDEAELAAAHLGADAPNPDTLSPDSLVITGSGANPAVPDVVTDIGGPGGGALDPAAAPTLSHIGRYALKRQLGSGGLGAVFEAWDPLLSRAVAIKTLQLDLPDGERTSLDGLFLNEARAAAGLNHRYIVTVHDAGLSPHGVYIAMERLYGRDLHRALADGWRPRIEQTVTLVRRVAEALSYAHSRGVVHCDIKPANIFLQRKDRPKVLDFGIARIVHGGVTPGLEGAVVGSPRYRAPEQLQGGPIDARADLFSLGAVMYEMLAGRRAFEGESLAQINQAVLAGPPRPAHELDPNVPRELSEMVARLLARDAADRYTCASELVADLRRWTLDLQQRREALAATRWRTAAADAAAPRAAWIALLAAVAFAATAWAAWMWAGAGFDPRPTAAAAPSSPAVAHSEAVAPTTTPVPAGSGPALDQAAGDGVASPSHASPAGLAPPIAAGQAPDDPGAATGAAPAIRAKARAADAMPRQRPLSGSDLSPRDRTHDDDIRSTAGPAAPVASGLVHFAVTPWGEVEVDGVVRGTTPPLGKLSLPEGAYTITLRNADFAPHTVQVQVTADRPVTLRHRFGS